MNRSSLLYCSALVACIAAVGAPASAQDLREFNIPPGTLADALHQFAAQSQQEIFFSTSLAAGLRTQGVRGRYASSDALQRLLVGSDLTWSQTRPGVIVLLRSDDAQSAEMATELDEIVVTGTLLKMSGELASPIVTLDREALDQRGFATVAEALTDLPQNYAGSATPIVQLSNADPGGSNNVYATGVNLRGLGPASTLSLVNGRRLAGTGLRGEFADMSALPSAAVERVDVLLDGASALYGADAVAGVVNVLTRRSFEGHESRVRAAAAKGGAEDIMASHIAGRVWSSGAAYLSWEHQRTNGISSYDRSYTANGDLRPFGGSDHRNIYGTPGNILAFNSAASAYVSQFAIRPNASGTAQSPADFVGGAANLQSTTLGTDLLPSIKRNSAYGRMRQSIGDRLEITADVRYSRRDYELSGPASVGVFTVTRANPWFVSPTGAASHTVGYSFLRELGPTRQAGDAESTGVTAGARYDLDGRWSLDGYLAYAQEQSALGVYNRVHSRFLNEALGTLPDDPATPYRAAVDGYFNLFGDGSRNSRAVLDFIKVGYSEAHNLSRAASVNLLAQGPVMSLPGGDLQIAVGALARKETFEASASVFAATAAPVSVTIPGRERSISAVFAEARIPLVGERNARPGLRRLDLSLAGRFENYDDFGSTTNPKVGIVWSPVQDLGVRASWGTSFRAGALPQIYDSQGASATFLNRPDGSRALALLLVGGNTELTPETSETLTLGFDYKPRSGLAFSANYFNTRFKDRIGRPANENLAVALTDPALSTFVRPVSPATNPADLALIESYASLPGFSTLYPATTYAVVVDTRWVNTGAVEVSGFDVSGRYGRSLGESRLTVDTSASWMLNYDSQATPTAPVRSRVGLIGNPVKLRARSGVSWSLRDLRLSAHWSYVDAYKDRAGVRIDAWNTADVQASWSPSTGALAGLQLNLNVQNLFDADPPFYDSPMGYGFDAGQASLLGRVVALQLIRRW